MAPTLTLRRAQLSDLASVDALLARSYQRLLAADYPPSTMVLAVPRLIRARPDLLASGRYFLAEGADHRLLGAGGYSVAGADSAHVRHVATDPDVVRCGVGRALMGHVLRDARQAGMKWMDCLATRTAVPFYVALGFRAVFPTEVQLAPGIRFPVVRMLADLMRTSPE